MKPYELKRFYIYTDGYSFFEYIEREDDMFVFAEIEFERGCRYHTNPNFFIYMNKFEITDLKEYKV